MNATRKKKFAPQAKKSRLPWIVFLVLVVLPLLGGFIFLKTFDLNAYRFQIAEAATKGLGRTVSLNGPLAFDLSLRRGISLSAQDVSLANPSWASRPVMAKIGGAFVHVNWLKLLSKELDIVAFDLEKADILLETRANGENNWTFKSADGAAGAKDVQAEKAGAGGESVSINLQQASITDSRFGILSKDGKLSIFEVPSLVFKDTGKGIEASFKGSLAGTEAALRLTGGKLAAISGPSWPFDLDASYGPLSVRARGGLADGVKYVTLSELSLAAGSSQLDGALNVSLAGARPSVKGNLKGKKVDPADFAFSGADQGADGTAQKSSKAASKIFTRDPLPLEGLRAADLDLMVTLDELKAGVMPLRSVILPVKLVAGKLDIAPFSALIGGNKASGRLQLDASQSVPRLALSFAEKDLDMAQLLSLWGLEAVIVGKADLDLDLTASGGSTYAMASSANGSLKMQMDGGTVSQSAVKNIASGLLDLFAPGAKGLTNPGVNCVAARYAITNGLVQTKGLLIDTDVTTIAGLGTINLPDEHINMSFYTKPKALGLTAALPPMKVYGDLTGPSFTLDAGAIAQKVVGLLTKEGQDTVVPTLVSVAKGQNACAATLDNPAAAKAAAGNGGGKTTLLPSTGSMQDKIKDAGGKLLRGLGSGLFGQ